MDDSIMISSSLSNVMIWRWTVNSHRPGSSSTGYRYSDLITTSSVRPDISVTNPLLASTTQSNSGHKTPALGVSAMLTVFETLDPTRAVSLRVSCSGMSQKKSATRLADGEKSPLIPDV